MNHDQWAMIDDQFAVIDDHVTVFDGVVTTTAETGEFEARLADWAAGVPMRWAELMAAWVELPTTSVSRSLVLRLIMGLLEK